MRKYIMDAFMSAGIYVYSAARGGYGNHILTREQAEELFSSYKSKFTDINGLRIHYRDEGQGEPIMLLHGFASSLHTWQPWTDRLVAEGYRVIRLDLPGFGLSDSPPRRQLNVASFNTFLTTFLDQLGVQNCHFAGNSFGGWVSWEFALAHPQRVDKLVLIDSAGYFTKGTRAKTVDYANKPFFKKLLAKGVPRFLVKNLLTNAFADNTKINDFMLNRYYGLANKEGNLASLIKYSTQQPTAHTDQIKDITQPTLIMWGAKDKVIHYVDALKFKHDIKNSRLQMYENVGHVPMVEIPEQSADDLLVFLKE